MEHTRFEFEGSKNGRVGGYVSGFPEGIYIAMADSHLGLPVTQAPLEGEPPAHSREAAVDSLRRALERSD